MVVHGMMEAPGLVQLSGQTLTIQPIVGKQVQVSLSQLLQVAEFRFYNGRLYLGSCAFFRLKVPHNITDSWRIGFGVTEADSWRKHLPLGPGRH